MIKSGLVILKNLLGKQKTNLINAKSQSVFVVLPWHLDLNFHVNNAKYLSYANQARLEFLAEHGVLKFLLKNKLTPILYKNEIEYKKSLKVFDLFSVLTTITAIEERHIEIEHVFSKREEIIAVCRSFAKVKVPKTSTLKALIEDYHEKTKL